MIGAPSTIYFWKQLFIKLAVDQMQQDSKKRTTISRKRHRNLSGFPPVQPCDTTSVRQRFGITKKDDDFAASNYLNFSKVNIAKFPELYGDITSKDLTFVPLHGKKV